MSANCRSCQAPMRWAVNVVTGARLPLDPEPVEGGNLVLADPSPGPMVRVMTVREATERNLDFSGMPRYQAHFTSCPHADQHRRARR